jgi:vitamin B12 transporter
MMKGFIATLLPLFATITLHAQITTISGRVTTLKNEPIVGANVFIEGSYDGATTDTLGQFLFKTEEKGNRQLLATFIGCDTFKQAVGLNGSPLSIEAHLKSLQNELAEVVVSAGIFEAASDKKRATVLSSLDIALTASASADIAGAITTLPGTTRNGETGQILVRGGAGYETRTFMDGLLVQNPYNSTVPNLPARNRFSPFLFKGTLFSTGGYSAEYGQAMSSALILNTEDLAPKTTTGISLLSVGASAAHTQRWERTSLSVTGEYSNLSPYFALVPQKVDWVKAPQTIGNEVVFRHKTSETGMLKIYTNASRSSMKMNYPMEENPNQTTPLQLRGDNIYTNISYRDAIGKDWALFVGGAYTYNEDAINSTFNNTKNHQSAQMRFTLARQFAESFKLKFGSEVLKSRYNEVFKNENAEYFNTLLKDNYAAAFVESDVYFSNKIVGRVGGRFEYSSLLNKTNIAPRASLAYVLGKNEQVALAFGQFYQTPQYDLMRRSTQLNYENATHLMLNYQRIRNGYTFRIEGYQKWYDDLVKTDGTSGLPNNNGGGYARGVDVFFRDNKNIKNGDYWLSYSYLDTKRDWRTYPSVATPNFAMKHSFSAVFKQFFPKWNTALSASYAFNSGRPYTDPNLGDGFFNASRTPAYHDLSTAITYLTNIKGHFTIFYLSVQNVLGLNQTFGYQYSASPNAMGRYDARAITPPAKRFGVLAIIMSIGQQYKKSETTTDDF